MAEFNPRIEELRRRILKDPASIAFAQLAEEHRRVREFDDAIRVCRAGLAQHPAYLSARITLGRTLLEVGQIDEAATEFEYVRKAAPDNLTALRELADIHQRRRVTTHQTRSTEKEAPQEPIAAAPEPAAVAPAPIEDTPPAPVEPTPASVWLAPEPSPVRVPEPPPDPVLMELEAWLSAVTADRDQRTSHV